MQIAAGSLVKLKSFHKTVEAPDDVSDNENYWKLIGLSGRVIEKGTKHPAFVDMGMRVLVLFDEDIASYGLISHNEQPNTLWIFVVDLSME